MTHNERKHRRQLIAEEVDNGASYVQIVKKWGVTTATIRNSCREHGISLLLADSKLVHTFKVGSLRIVAELLNTEDPHERIAARLGISRTRVYQVQAAAKEAGITIPKRVRSIRAKKVHP